MQVSESRLRCQCERFSWADRFLCPRIGMRCNEPRHDECVPKEIVCRNGAAEGPSASLPVNVVTDGPGNGEQIAAMSLVDGIGSGHQDLGSLSRRSHLIRCHAHPMGLFRVRVVEDQKMGERKGRPRIEMGAVLVAKPPSLDGAVLPILLSKPRCPRLDLRTDIHTEFEHRLVAGEKKQVRSNVVPGVLQYSPVNLDERRRDSLDAKALGLFGA